MSKPDKYKYIGLASSIIGGVGGLYFAFSDNLIMTFIGVIILLFGLFAINRWWATRDDTE
jgi:uncharacterized membrane protein